MQVYSQKSISTTLPRSPDMASGGELIHSVEGADGPGVGAVGACTWFWRLEEGSAGSSEAGAATGNSGAL